MGLGETQSDKIAHLGAVLAGDPIQVLPGLINPALRQPRTAATYVSRDLQKKLSFSNDWSLLMQHNRRHPLRSPLEANM